MARVFLDNVSRVFGTLEAVKNLTLEADDGKFVCILGPSGCGKTTTLRMIAGLDSPTQGNVIIGDKVVNGLTPKERNIAMVFQFYAIYPGMTVFENMAFPLEQGKVPHAEIKRRVTETAEMLGIPEILDKIAMDLTAGEKQRVALGRAMVRDPEVFLLDEPLTNLDAQTRAVMRVELKKLHLRLKRTTIYVTHDQLEAVAMADRVAVMKKGELQQYDTPVNLFNRPKNLFVAGFIGSPAMNLVDCSLATEGKNMLLKFDSVSLDISEFKDAIMQQKHGSELVFGIRPTALSIQKQPVNGGIQAEVFEVEPTGERTIVDLRLEGHESLTRVSIARTNSFAPGDKVWMVLDKNKIHIFDKQTSELLI